MKTNLSLEKKNGKEIEKHFEVGENIKETMFFPRWHLLYLFDLLTSKIWTFVFMIYIVIMQKENQDLSRYDKKFNSKNSFQVYAISLK